MKDKLLVEKYRPQKIDDCVLPPELKSVFKSIVESGDIPNMILSGSAGCGKTTVAKAMCNELNIDYMMINASEESGIDVLRSKIRSYASSMSMTSDYKVVILDEADYLNRDSTQPALRSFIEDFSNNCRFILTCNFKNKIIEPLHSRCTPVDFGSINKKQLASLCGLFLKRLEFILKTEKIEYKQAVLIELIKRHAPDWRRIINECDRHSRGGVLTTSAISDEGFNKSIVELIGYLGSKDFKSMRNWCAEHAQLDGVSAFRSIYDNVSRYAEPKTIPSAILILADYMYKSSFMADKEINMVACMTELMSEVQWKRKS